MHCQTLLLTLAGLAATVSATGSPAARPGVAAIAARADATACAASATKIENTYPTPTDSALSSFLDAQTAETFSVPSSLQKQFCTYEASEVNWYSSVAQPFLSGCSQYLPDDLLTVLSLSVTTETWCASVTKNVAGPRETGAMAGIMAAAGLAVAML